MKKCLCYWGHSTDITDLEEKIVDTPNDIEAVYQNLLNGSYNHLNAFSKQIL